MARRSWEQSTDYDGVDLPGDDFDYRDFAAREFGGAPHRRIGIRWYWWVTAVLLLALMALAGGALF